MVVVVLLTVGTEAGVLSLVVDGCCRLKPAGSLNPALDAPLGLALKERPVVGALVGCERLNPDGSLKALPAVPPVAEAMAVDSATAPGFGVAQATQA